MLFVVAALAGAPGEVVPLPQRSGPGLRTELRLGHGAQARADGPLDEPWRPTPNVGVVGELGVGGPMLDLALGLHVGVEAPADGPPGWRVEPRMGFRATMAFGGFLAPAVGWSATSVADAASGSLAIGWRAPGEGIRPVVALEGRIGPIHELRFVCDGGCGGSPLPNRRFSPAGNGIVVSAGVSSVAHRRARVPP